MSNQETKQEQIQFPAQQELKHLRTRCGKVYALGNNRFRAVVQNTPVHEYDVATHQWVELSAEKRQQMAAQAHSPIATFADSANSAENAAGILDTYVKEGSTQNFSHDERLWISNTNYYGNRLTYLKVVDLPRLGANHFITSAKLCVRNVYAPTADTAIMCKEVLEGWDPETITYDHQPNVSGVYQDYCRVLKKSVFVERTRCHEPCAQVVSGRKSRCSAERTRKRKQLFAASFERNGESAVFRIGVRESCRVGELSDLRPSVCGFGRDWQCQPCQWQPDFLSRGHGNERQSPAGFDYALLQFL